MHYFILASKDSYITEKSSGQVILYPDSTDRNFGGDEVLELKKEYVNSYSTSPYNVSRILTQFDYSDVSASIVDGTITNPRYYLRYYEVEGQSQLDKSYSLSSFPVSSSWEEGVGKHYDNPAVKNGVTWQSGSNAWSLVSNTNADSGSRTTGGGVWITGSGYEASQSFVDQSGDIEMDVTDIVNKHLDNTIFNNGFILKYNDEEGDSQNLKFFSKNTHTIYAPRLEVRWDDHIACSGSNTGSLVTLTMSGELDNHIFMKGLKFKYTEDETVRFRIGCRKKCVQKTFTESVHNSEFYIKENRGYYSFIDVATDTPIIPFSEYTKLSCDSTSLYFDQILSTFEPGRFYKILFKVVYDDGQEIIYNNDEEFKIV